jgi:hypothetical protein
LKLFFIMINMIRLVWISCDCNVDSSHWTLYNNQIRKVIISIQLKLFYCFFLRFYWNNLILFLYSCDAGTTIKCDKEFEKLMEQLARKLNLSKHKCGFKKEENGVFILLFWLSRIVVFWFWFWLLIVDLLIFLCEKDNRNYVIDPARLFPPEYIDPQQQSKVPTRYFWSKF